MLGEKGVTPSPRPPPQSKIFEVPFPICSHISFLAAKNIQRHVWFSRLSVNNPVLGFLVVSCIQRKPLVWPKPQLACRHPQPLPVFSSLYFSHLHSTGRCDIYHFKKANVSVEMHWFVLDSNPAFCSIILPYIQLFTSIENIDRLLAFFYIYERTRMINRKIVMHKLIIIRVKKGIL
jgi:hypothetical protein